MDPYLAAEFFFQDPPDRLSPTILRRSVWWLKSGRATVASDIYAFGVVLYELLAGVAPFGDSGSVEALVSRKLVERIPSVGAGRPDLPSAVDLAIQTATDPDPQRRFADMGEMILAFRAACGDVLVGASTTGTPMTAPPTERPRRQASQTLLSLELQAANPYRGLVAFGEAADFGRPIVHLQVDVQMVVGVPGSLDVLAPQSLQVGGHTAGPRAANEEVATELEVQSAQIRIIGAVFHRR